MSPDHGKEACVKCKKIPALLVEYNTYLFDSPLTNLPTSIRITLSANLLMRRSAQPTMSRTANTTIVHFRPALLLMTSPTMGPTKADPAGRRGPTHVAVVGVTSLMSHVSLHWAGSICGRAGGVTDMIKFSKN